MIAARCGMRVRRGALLMEVMLSLTLFATAGLSILALVRASMADLERTRQTQHAASIARSAMARIESGIDDPATLNGPVRLWDGREAAMSAGVFNDPLASDAPGGADAEVDPLWELEVRSEPSRFDGLNEVRVRAFRLASPDSDRVAASYTLHQLVRLGTRDEDAAGERGELLEEALRGAGGGS